MLEGLKRATETVTTPTKTDCEYTDWEVISTTEDDENLQRNTGKINIHFRCPMLHPRFTDSDMHLIQSYTVPIRGVNFSVQGCPATIVTRLFRFSYPPRILYISWRNSTIFQVSSGPRMKGRREEGQDGWTQIDRGFRPVPCQWWCDGIDASLVERCYRYVTPLTPWSL